MDFPSSQLTSRRPSIDSSSIEQCVQEQALNMKVCTATFKPSLASVAQPFKPEAKEVSTLAQGLNSLKIANDFTPSTPYVHKFRTEMCKNWELYGKCKYGDEVSNSNKFKNNSSSNGGTFKFKCEEWQHHFCSIKVWSTLPWKSGITWPVNYPSSGCVVDIPVISLVGG